MQPPPCPDAVPLPPPHASQAGLWALLGLILAVIVIDALLYYAGRPTMSQEIQRKLQGRPWWKVVAGAIIGLTLWHLLFGGPI